VARQKLGQHFLTKGSILERIAAVACPSPSEAVMEIGAGRGALTEKLLLRAARVIAVELDPHLAEHLRLTFAGEPHLEIVEADALELDFAQFGRVNIAGNLPYYAASPIMRKTVRLAPPRAVFLIQKEVALRLAASPGERDYGLLTVETALYAKARLLFEVKPKAFHPPPKVDSALVLLEPSGEPLPEDADDFLRFVGRAFQHKRKTLRNNLTAFYGREALADWPEAGMRAEQIPLKGFLDMWRRLRPEPRPPVVGQA
jgi:16S rRNA (adenine1518-N6/adenine1519-N6)-dimethyltransferase